MGAQEIFFDRALIMIVAFCLPQVLFFSSRKAKKDEYIRHLDPPYVLYNIVRTRTHMLKI